MSNEYISESGKVICQLCKKHFSIISPTHLKNSHSITLKEYKKQFPDAAVSSDIFKAKQRFNAVEMFGPIDEFKNEEEIFSKLKDKNNNTDDEVFFESVKSDQEEKALKENIPYNDKREIFSYLRKVFPNIKNNYKLEIYSLSGNLSLSTITDIADPILKIDFEFPDAFWHNENRAVIHNRKEILEKYDWKLISFESIPSINELKKICSKMAF